MAEIISFKTICDLASCIIFSSSECEAFFLLKLWLNYGLSQVKQISKWKERENRNNGEIRPVFTCRGAWTWGLRLSSWSSWGRWLPPCRPRACGRRSGRCTSWGESPPGDRNQIHWMRRRSFPIKIRTQKQVNQFSAPKKQIIFWHWTLLR